MTEPRITPLPRDEWTDEVTQGIAALMPPGVDRPLRRRKGGSKGLNVLGTLARHPKLMHAYHSFNGHILFTSSLSPRQRELLILRVAALRDARVRVGAARGARGGGRHRRRRDCPHRRRS